MKKHYDFSKGEKNPYYKKLKGQKIKMTDEVSFDLKDLLKIDKKSKKTKLEKEITDLNKRLTKLEKRLGRS
ncbi:MAG: hypothetical protein AB7H97_08800 [Pseudobdellovibrionaceae bacterium]